MTDYQRGLRGILEQPVSPDVAVGRVVEHYLRWMETNRESALLILSVEHADIRELAADRITELNAPLVDLVEEWATQHVQSHRLPPVIRPGRRGEDRDLLERRFRRVEIQVGAPPRSCRFPFPTAAA